MKETLNIHRPSSRTLAVIDGGIHRNAVIQAFPSTPKLKLLDQVRQAIRTRHYSPRTEETYVHWIKRFIHFHDKRHPAEMAEAEIARFLSSVATESHVSASTQNQALNAILFLYRQVLRKEIGYVDGVVRAKGLRRLPVVLTKAEVKSVLGCLTGTPWLMAMLLYGAGLRLMECCRLRVKDIDFAQNEILVRAGKGDKDRHTTLPAVVKDPLPRHLHVVRRSMRRTSGRAWGVSLYLTLFNVNTRALAKSGFGSGCSPQRAILQTG